MSEQKLRYFFTFTFLPVDMVLNVKKNIYKYLKNYNKPNHITNQMCLFIFLTDLEFIMSLMNHKLIFYKKVNLFIGKVAGY